MSGSLRRVARRRLVLVAVVSVVLTSAWLGVLWYGAHKQAPVARGAFVADYDGRELHDGLEILIVQGDGQAFATLARDPLLRRPESFLGPGEAAYRAQRPLLPYLAWAGSLGQPGWVPPALATLAVLGVGLAVAGAGALIANRGRSPWFGLLLLLVPGVSASLQQFGPETLTLGLLLWALTLWERDHKDPAALLFALAALGRETALLVPLVLGVEALWRRHRRDCVLLLIGPAVVGAWWTALRLRTGSWPTEAGDGRLGAPLVGLFDAARTRWEQSVQTELLFLLVGVLIVVAALVFAPRDRLTAMVVVHAAFATMMGDRVWGRIEFYGRVLLPLYALGIIVVVREFDQREVPSEASSGGLEHPQPAPPPPTMSDSDWRTSPG